MFEVKCKLLHDSVVVEENIFNKREKNKKYFRDVIFFNESFLKGELTTVCTKNILAMKMQFSMAKNIKYSISIEKDYIGIFTSINGNNRVIKSTRFEVEKAIELENMHRFSGNSNESISDISSDDDGYLSMVFFVKRKYYLKLMKKMSWRKECSFYKDILLNKVVTWENCPMNLNLDIVENIFRIFTQNIYNEKQIYWLKLKLQELFLLSHLSQGKREVPSILKNEDIKKLQHLKNYLDLNFIKNPKIKDLSHMFYLNELKIKSGFKLLYDITIHQYILKLKMIEASNLLRENLLINEVANKLGFKTSSHFISSFKKYYGITPKKFINSFECKSV